MTSYKILVVDDQRGVRESIRMLLKDQYAVAMIDNGTEALDALTREQPDIVLLDLRLNDMHGIDVLQNIKAQDPTVEVILMTAYATVETARKALRLGAYDYLTKPFDPQELEKIVRRAIERRITQLQSSARLEAIQGDLLSLRQQVETAKYQIATHVRDTIHVLLMSLELRDAYSGQHSMAVLWLVDHFAQRLGLSDAERMRLKRAALVHDLGKIGIPEEILNKPEPLSPEDQDVMQHHPILSAEIIGNVEALADLAPIVRAHHERWDGLGYPDQLVGEAIPWEAQVLSLCDAVHAMSGNRCYRTRLDEAHIRAELSAQSGHQFKAEFVDVMLNSTLIADVYQAENDGKLVLTSHEIRKVLDETPQLESEELPGYRAKVVPPSQLSLRDLGL